MKKEETHKHEKPLRLSPFKVSTYGLAFFITSMVIIAALAYINPGEILRKRRDEIRKAQIRNLSEALFEYYSRDLAHRYPPHTDNATFIQGFENAGVTLPAIQKVGAVDYIGCSGKENEIVEYNGICYVPDDMASPSLVLVYTRLESQAAYRLCYQSKDRPIPYYLWSSLQGKIGFGCYSEDPSDPSVDYIFVE